MLRTLEREPGPGAPGSTPSDVEAPGTSRSPRLLCAACGSTITTAASRTEVLGEHRHIFCNPAGVVFEIGCFGEAPGAVAVGPAEHFFSWFPGYPWRLAHCRGCLAHLGWAYGDDDFWGLVLVRLVDED